jgi:hypothetical protein
MPMAMPFLPSVAGITITLLLYTATHLQAPRCLSPVLQSIYVEASRLYASEIFTASPIPELILGM